jgi:hypothetical protein
MSDFLIPDFFFPENAGGEPSAGMAGIKEEIEKRSSFQKHTFSKVLYCIFFYLKEEIAKRFSFQKHIFSKTIIGFFFMLFL